MEMMKSRLRREARPVFVRAALHSPVSFVNSSRDQMPHTLEIAGEASYG
jgi:hypothetical protein